ncbi:hypothetical protein FCM35_KLT16647 [Carex littledalei]|uniref:Uncharacterized protein n=1 Tax=Carex littledalei TaxID=544730 RepID=A0A833VI14_9POAL|nr:hypothetical protein FCM35_KLT16647 [Carex littledalei]
MSLSYASIPFINPLSTDEKTARALSVERAKGKVKEKRRSPSASLSSAVSSRYLLRLSLSLPPPSNRHLILNPKGKVREKRRSPSASLPSAYFSRHSHLPTSILLHPPTSKL